MATFWEVTTDTKDVSVEDSNILQLTKVSVVLQQSLIKIKYSKPAGLKRTN
jgi:hypothetical protein